jgi:hypothetical protein
VCDVLDDDVVRGRGFQCFAEAAVEGVEDVEDLVDEGIGGELDIIEVGTEEVFVLCMVYAFKSVR